ncbi:porin [Photobacterium alginatilyticum]|uniref:porin n=1 Tax=Photobacterium alginatilyticum TaxID=1775171 RepID=UPI004067BC40
MENMFKRSVVGVAVAAAAMASVSVQAKPATDTVDLYGQVAVSVWGGEAQDDTLDVLNESRFGLRGTVDLEKGPKVFWQMEAGDVGDGQKEEDGGISRMGFRDTYIGFDFDDVGKLRIGRVLTPAYEIVDWPYSGQKRGEVFDWVTDVEGGVNYDRHGDSVRFDSAQFGAVNFSLAAGKGNVTEEDNNFYGAAAHVKAGPAVLHLGYEYGTDRRLDKDDENSVRSDTQLIIAGFEATFGSFGLHGAYKIMGAEYDNNAPDQDQTAFSVGASYSMDDWLFRLGYAAQQDLETGNVKTTANAEDIVSFDATYFIDPNAEVWVRPYQLTKGGDSKFGFGVGIGYYF